MNEIILILCHQCVCLIPIVCGFTPPLGQLLYGWQLRIVLVVKLSLFCLPVVF